MLIFYSDFNLFSFMLFRVTLKVKVDIQV